MSDEPQRRGLRFDGTIHAGHILMLGSMLVGGATAYATLQADIRVLRTEMEGELATLSMKIASVQTESNLALVAAQSQSGQHYAAVADQMRRLEAAMERLEARLYTRERGDPR